MKIQTEKYCVRLPRSARKIIGLFVVAFTASAITVFADDRSKREHSEHDTKNASMIKQLKGVTGKQFDAEFLKKMTQHHQDAVKMGKLAQSHSSKSELKKLAQQMSAKQSDEIEHMTHLLQSNHGQKPEPMSMDDPAMKKMMHHMRELESLHGAEFDQKFISTTLEHHREGMDMAKLALDRAQSDVVKKLAQEIIKDQTKEISQLQAMNKGSSQ